ncbi:MFS transporter [Marinobacter persicus]|uniref:MFS family arabinose efflux permease n=1 Tax=Marinobacter persicus TaxID=930118 RepID=A0A2S6G560_9GAMM|nr:MFS transporter [Marinobacter persicus]PPK50792.1 putative MFS family arabinose efflux permease [Marinobacter persicus]PPK54244.1 putative MFS family arabinose efflux permease [Marinobacter persicus]PPK57380.1 putative MFS family arabinose efflux permease [Marinobacter persicus]
MSRLPLSSLFLIISGCLMLMLSFGLRSSFGLFVEPIGEFNDWGRDILGLALAIQNLAWGVVAVVAGGLADRFGTTKVLVAGAALYAGGILMTVNVTDVWSLNAGLGVLIGAGVAGTSFGIVLPAMAQAVAPEQRQLVLGIGTAAASAGQFLLVPVIGQLVESLGWNVALQAMAGMALVMALLAMPLARPRGHDGHAAAHHDQNEPSFSEIVRIARGHRPYWLLILGFFVCGFHVAFITVHLPPFLTEAGFSTSVAAWSISLIGLFNIAGSLLSGVLSGRFGLRNVLIAIYGARALLITLFLVLPLTQVSVILFSCVMGVLWLATVPPTSGLVSTMFGTRYMATFYGVVYLGHQVGSFSGVWLGGVLYELTGNYNIVWWLAVGLSLVAMALHWPISETKAEAKVQNA